jgi:hypothetical protein
LKDKTGADMVKISDVTSFSLGLCCDAVSCRHVATLTLRSGEQRTVEIGGDGIESLALVLPAEVFKGDLSHFSGLFRMQHRRRPSATDAQDLLQGIFDEPRSPVSPGRSPSGRRLSLLQEIDLHEVYLEQPEGPPSEPGCRQKTAACWSNCLACLTGCFR